MWPSPSVRLFKIIFNAFFFFNSEASLRLLALRMSFEMFPVAKKYSFYYERPYTSWKYEIGGNHGT